MCHNLIVSNIEDRPILRIVGPSGGFVNFGSTYYPVSVTSSTLPLCTELVFSLFSVYIYSTLSHTI